MIRAFTYSLRRFWRRKDGTATVEFALLFPAFMTVFLASAELGILSLRNVMLERSLHIVVREIRLGLNGTPTHDGLKTAICDQAGIFPGCEEAINLELRRVDTDTWIPGNLDNANCADRTEEMDPVIEFTPGGANDLMLIRVCVVFDPFLPTGALASRMNLDMSGGYALVATSAFVVEP